MLKGMGILKGRRMWRMLRGGGGDVNRKGMLKGRGCREDVEGKGDVKGNGKPSCLVTWSSCVMVPSSPHVLVM